MWVILELLHNSEVKSKFLKFTLILLLILDIQSVEGLAIDWLSRNVYWTDSKKDTIEVASLDNNKLRKVLVKEGLVNPRGIAVHPSRGSVFS